MTRQCSQNIPDVVKSIVKAAKDAREGNNWVLTEDQVSSAADEMATFVSSLDEYLREGVLTQFKRRLGDGKRAFSSTEIADILSRTMVAVSNTAVSV